MGYKRFSDIDEAEDMIRRAEDGEYNNRSTMYNILVQIKSEWKDKHCGKRAQELIDELFSDLAVFNED